MCVLGIRAEADGFQWAVLGGTASTPSLRAYGSETAPNSYDEGERLVWIRRKCMQALETHKPTRVAIRYPEGNARGANKASAKARCRVEGVILEAAASKNVSVVTGALNTFGKHSGSESPKADLDRHDLHGIDWSEHNRNLREAILVGTSLLPKK
jgi:hypothetical protein